MKFTIKTLCMTLCATFAIGAIGVAAGQDGGLLRKHGGSEHRAQRLERREFARSLRFSPEQRAQALQAARAVQPTVEAARSEARQIITAARTANPSGDRAAIRDAVRTQIQELRDRARAQVEPSARALVATLSQEQRQELEERAKAHGLSFDENRMIARLARKLARPRAVLFLERRQGR